jgi:hypothetical protein
MELPTWDAKSLEEQQNQVANARTIANDEEQKQQVAIAYGIVERNMLQKRFCEVVGVSDGYHVFDEQKMATLTTPQWRQIQTVLRTKGFVVFRATNGYVIQFPVLEEPY